MLKQFRVVVANQNGFTAAVHQWLLMSLAMGTICQSSQGLCNIGLAFTQLDNILIIAVLIQYQMLLRENEN